ncbi:aldehyde dehydrogenase family protein [uncultured Paracoccus sp.]|uniref:aldehyde dehydrogenase family protein n=1 Tax=uncultured Paracoccus sp. TaxID=189685 RepID=UPI002616445A|nr:aldehyde dehydrogenase family protein [uncultured Paracoccus sp.]
MSDFKLLIGGKLVDGMGQIDVIDPSTGMPFATAPVADEEQLDEAVAAANAALAAWAGLPLSARAAMLASFADRIEDEAPRLARLLTREQGKPLPQALFEVEATIRGIRHFAACDLPDQRRPHAAGEYTLRRVPLGVVACIVPWNFPLVLASNKYGAALLAGNTVILKPAPTTPLTTLELGRIALGVFPPGVFNVLSDAGDLGPALTAHPDIAKIAFTGSTPTGKRVMAGAAETLKRVTLELGGNDAAIVLADADLEAAISGLTQTAFLNAGQICVAPKRIYVHASIHDRFCEGATKLARAMTQGAGLDEGVEIGPVQNRAQFEKLKDYLSIARQDGTVLCGGEAAHGPGYFIPPTVVRDLADDSRLVTEEQFGPIMPILSFEDEDEVLGRANASPFGLGGSVWSRDTARGQRLAWQMQVGMVWVNQHLAVGPDIPFAGAKASGTGVETGPEGIEEFTRVQVLIPAWQ